MSNGERSLTAKNIKGYGYKRIGFLDRGTPFWIPGHQVVSFRDSLPFPVFSSGHRSCPYCSFCPFSFFPFSHWAALPCTLRRSWIGHFYARIHTRILPLLQSSNPPSWWFENPSRKFPMRFFSLFFGNNHASIAISLF